MAALLLRRAFPSTLVPLASRSARSSTSSSCLLPPAVGSPGSSCSVLCHPLFVSRFMTFSTTAAMEHSSLIRSITGVSPHSKAQPRSPIPDGFPFTLTSEVGTLNFVRHGEDEKFTVEVDWESPKTINGNPCFGMTTSIDRGDWLVSFDIIAGSKMLLIKQVRIGRYYRRNLHCFEQLVESKGITKVIIQSLLALARNKDVRETSRE